MICVDCGGTAEIGSMKHPYCNKCFNKKFKDYDEYSEYLNKTHKM